MMRTALALGLVLAVPALAYAEDFATVDSYSAHEGNFTVTGIPVGQSQPVSKDYYFSGNDNFGVAAAADCHRSALLAMERPGRYVLTVSSGYNSYYCKLTRNSGK
jgi:hypothetical protein